MHQHPDWSFLIFVLIPKTHSRTKYPNPISDSAPQLFEPVASYQFIFSLKTRGIPSVETASQKLLITVAAVLWKSHSILVLLDDIHKLQRFFPLRHGKSCFIQVLLTEESVNDIVRTNPLQFNRAERMHFNENVALYLDLHRFQRRNSQESMGTRGYQYGSVLCHSIEILHVPAIQRCCACNWRH